MTDKAYHGSQAHDLLESIPRWSCLWKDSFRNKPVSLLNGVNIKLKLFSNLGWQGINLTQRTQSINGSYWSLKNREHL